MTDAELKISISNYYTQFDLFIKALDTTKSKDSLNEEIQRRYDCYHTPVIAIIHSIFPLDSISNGHSRAIYYSFVNEEFKKFITLWKEFLDSVQ